MRISDLSDMSFDLDKAFYDKDAETLLNTQGIVFESKILYDLVLHYSHR